MDINKGDVFKCIQTMYSKTYPGHKDFIKGHIYKSYYDGCIIDEDGDSYHCISNEKADSYFKKLDNMKPVNKEDRVNHPSHYTWLKDKCGIEVIDIVRYMNFNLGNVIKYVLRAGHKSENGMTDSQKRIEDLKKAMFYLNDEIKILEDTQKTLN